MTNSAKPTVSPASLYEAPAVDLNTVIAVESALRKGDRKDPWYRDCLENFIDLLVYSDKGRIIVPVPNKDIDPEDIPTPQILTELRKHSDLGLDPVSFDLSTLAPLKEEYIGQVAEPFIQWLKRHPKKFRAWIEFQKTVEDKYVSRFAGRKHMFDFAGGAQDLLSEITGELETFSSTDIQYGLDTVLRKPFYGSVVAGKRYLWHPMRDAYGLGEFVASVPGYPSPPLRFGKWFTGNLDVVLKMHASDRLRLINDIKNAVQKAGMDRLYGELTVEQIQDICLSANLPARLTPWVKKALGGAAAVAGYAGGEAVLPMLPESVHLLLGGTAAFAVWYTMEMFSGQFQSRANDFKFLSWARRWPTMEKQATAP
jgi:hypothetical protein